MSAKLSRLQATHWGLVAAAAAVSAVAGAPGSGAILVGGATIGLSVLVYTAGLHLLVRARRPRLAIGVLFVKLLAFLGLGWFAFASGRAVRPDPIGFVVGLTCFPAAAVWEAMRARGS